MNELNGGHGSDCRCGCHIHDGHNKHDPSHEHYDHNHGSAVKYNFEINEAYVSLEAHTHEQAATVTLDIRPKKGRALAFADIVDVMVSIAVRAEAAGGVVGHIKAYARDGSAFAHASVTASDLAPVCEGDANALYGEGSLIQLVLIVLLLRQEDLTSICRAQIGCLPSRLNGA